MSRQTPWRTARKVMALSQPGKNDWYRIKNQIDGPTQVFIYDEIGYFGVSANDFIRDLADVNGPIEVHINSPGGEVFDGIAIYNALLARRDVSVHIDGLAASIASVIAMAGNPVLMARQAQMMIHDGHAMAIGNAADMRELANLLDRTSNNIAEIYSEHTGKPTTYWREVMKAEAWYNSAEAIECGLADRLLDSGAGRQVPNPTDTWDMGIFRGAASRPYVSERQSRHEPMTGIHAHDHSAGGAGDHDDGMHMHYHSHNGDSDHHVHQHAAWDPDNNGDDDSTPEGDTDHSHWYEDGSPRRGTLDQLHAHNLSTLATSIRNATYDSTPWNGSAAMSSAKSASDFRSICAGERSEGTPEEREHWALPHHKHPGAPPNRAGVNNALARLSQTQGLTNKSAAEKHLRAHQAAWAHEAGNQVDPSQIDEYGDTLLYNEEDAHMLIAALKGATGR